MNEINTKNNKQEQKLLRVEIADASGHKTLMLTPEETQEFVERQDNKWIFVDNTLIREEDLNSVNWTEADSVRVMPGLVGGAEKLIRIEVADQTGHQTLMLSPEQTQEFIEQQDDKWIFVDNMLVRESELWNVNWAETESVRIMPGLVGGQEELDESESLLEAILAQSREHAFTKEEGVNWKDGRIDRANGLIKCFEESLDSNKKALTMLKGVLEENSDSIRVARNNIVILGDLASYCVPIRGLLVPFHNVYSELSHSGFKSIEVHPKDHWISRPQSACIQVKSDPQIPSIDTMIGLILGLMNDKISFFAPEMSQLRTALVGLYGLDESPISEAMKEFLSKAHKSFEKSNGRFEVSGTDGWKWHIDYGDPEISGFSISSSIKGGPERLIVEDTFSDYYWWGDIENVLNKLTRWPKAIKSGQDDDVLDSSRGFQRMCDSDRVFSRLKNTVDQSKAQNEEILGVLFS